MGDGAAERAGDGGEDRFRSLTGMKSSGGAFQDPNARRLQRRAGQGLTAEPAKRSTSHDAFSCRRATAAAFRLETSRYGICRRHVAERQLADATDGEIWPDAMRLNVCIITKDDDFVHRKLVAKAGPVVVWVRVPNLRRCVLLSWFERALPK